MRKAIALLLAAGLTLLLAACAAADAPESVTPLVGGTPGATRSILRMLYDTEVDTFNYLRTDSAADLQMSANMIDCLVEYDAYGIMRPALAVSWQSNEDASEWTFHIRPEVAWVDADGNEVAQVTAHDWVAAGAYVLDAANRCTSAQAYHGIVKNAAAYYAQTAAVHSADSAVQAGEFPDAEAYYAASGIDPSALTLTMDDVGVQAVDEYTLVYTMENPCAYFPSLLSCAAYMPVYRPFLEQAGEGFGADHRAILYNGAFLMTGFEPGNHRTLVKNPAYWDAGNVYIEEMEWLYHADAQTQAAEFFLRDVVDDAPLSEGVRGEWLENPQRSSLVSAGLVSADFTYFYAFNFEPGFDAAYEPDNWSRAVNNENFRHAIRAGLDRVNALAVYAPLNPAALRSNTITPPGFAVHGGKDYTQYGPLLPFTNGDGFDEAAACNYRDLARDELTAAGCTFPVKILMPFDPGLPDGDAEYLAVEQQLEALLGADFIDIIVSAGPPDDFFGMVRRTGAYALLKCGLRAEYADPQAWADPAGTAQSVDTLRTDANLRAGGTPAASDYDVTRAAFMRYYELVAAVGGIFGDNAARYEALAKAEAYLLDHALVIPFSRMGERDRVTRLNLFEGQYAPHALVRWRYKNMRVYDLPIDMAQFDANLAAWQTARAAAIAASE